MMSRKIKFVFFFIFSVGIILGNNKSTIDSLLSLLPTAQDTTRINTLLVITKYYQKHGDIPKARNFCMQAIELSKKEKDVSFLASSYCIMGGDVCNGTGDFVTAIDYLLKAYHLIEKKSNKKWTYIILNDLGNSYIGQKNFNKALEFYEQANEVADSLHDQRAIGITLIGKGNVYLSQKDYNKAIDVFSKAANRFDKAKLKYEYAMAKTNIGGAYLAMNENDKALRMFTESYQVMEEMDDKYGMGNILLDIGTALQQSHNYELALTNYYKSMQLFKSILSIFDLKEVYLRIAQTYNKQNKNDSAFHYMELYSTLTDSLYNKENSKLVAEMQTKFEAEKKEKENRLLSTQNELSSSKIKQQSRVAIGLMLFSVIVIVFLIFLYRSNKQKQKANFIISQQKEKVEGQQIQLLAKNKEIVDSITYAKRLQDAILPSIKIIQKYFPESFVIYKPKDIVAGDFYWMESVNRKSKKENEEKILEQESALSAYEHILIAAADCTGHGVPGAIGSVVCSNAMNRTLREFGITDPGKILDKVRELVVKTFVREGSTADEKNENVVKDGMDISLISIEGLKTDTKRTVKWAGANNPLWIIKKKNSEEWNIKEGRSLDLPTSDYRLIEIKPDKQPIGKMDIIKPFTTHTMQLNKGDVIYLFTDGYADQFGGPKGKKFKYQQLKELLLLNSQTSMEEQKTILNSTLENWKGSLEQVDDILVMGIKV
jgi:tetratricopeptide (TPR) repeat protein